MAKKAYIGVGGKARKVKKAYVGIQQFEKRELPEGYTHVEYIESSGTQYVDTGVEGLPPIRAEVGVATVASLTSSMFLAVRGTDGGSAALGYWHEGTWYTSMSPYIGQTENNTVTANTKYDFMVDIAEGKQTVSVNGNVLINDTVTGLTGTTTSLYVFARNNRGTASHQASAKIYYLRLYRNNTLVRDYVPCINSTGVAGLYDLVNSKFYGNSGTGSFSVGSTVESTARRIKKGYIGIGGGTTYREVEYIESSGTQYVDTGFKPNQNTRVSLDFEINAGAISTTTSLLGGRTAYQNNDFSFWCFNTSQWLTVYGTELAYIDAGSFTGRHTLNKNKNVTTIDGKTSTVDFNNFQSPNNLLLFTKKQDGAMESKFAVMKVYACQIYDNGTLVRDYVPSIDKNGVAGLFDKVSKHFYGNAGSGSFAYGAETGNTYISNGVARPFMSGGELAYYGTITPLSQARYNLAATTVGNYALFGGGQDTMMEDSRANAYNTSLTKVTVENLRAARCNLAATTVGNYALFGGGGNTEPRGYQDVDAYDTSLTRSSLPYDLSVGRFNLAATTVGDYAIFGAGSTSRSGVTSRVDAFNKSLTRSNPTNSSNANHSPAATTVGDYALFGGGTDGLDAFSFVDVYNTSLTHTTATSLSQARNNLAATTVGDYALFGGGNKDDSLTGAFSTIDAYNKSLTRTTATSLSYAREDLSATSVNGYAIFAGGLGTSPSAAVDVYDTSLTRTTHSELSAKRYALVATTIGNYALFGGGYAYVGVNWECSSTVDAYVVA